MKHANFFILGAPKCGTTSLNAWLSEHPMIYMATKEPHYFNTDHQNRKIHSLADYQALFAAATQQQSAIGEASVRYLYSTEAVANILAFNPDAKFIVMLRNPMDMVYSWHNQLCFNGMEDVYDFDQAWQLQGDRMAGKHMPPRCREIKMLYYGQVCSLGEQLQRLYAQVHSEHVQLIFLEDLAHNSKRTYQTVLKFLGVDDDGRRDFTVFNSAKQHRSRFAQKVLWQAGDYLSWLGKLKQKLGIRYKFGLFSALQQNNTLIQKRPALPLQTRQTLIAYFKDDIALLSRLSGRNLEHWR